MPPIGVELPAIRIQPLYVDVDVALPIGLGFDKRQSKIFATAASALLGDGALTADLIYRALKEINAGR
jgi:deoxyxylulose-5-phosphate synthase